MTTVPAQSSSIHAIVPLALLEAIRNLDTPIDDGLAELATETVARRLGMSSTVAAQIERYRGAAGKGGRIPLAEACQVFRLVGRRPDATLVYSDAGRRAARLAARGTGPRSGVKGLLPRGPRRRLGEHAAMRISERTFGLLLVREASGLGVRLTTSLATESGFVGAGCYFYSALLAELLRVTSGFEGAMVHASCLGAGQDACSWRSAEAEEW